MNQLRPKLGAASIAVAFAIYLTSPSLVTIWLPASWAFLLVGVWAVERQRPQTWVIGCIGVIVGSAWLAVPLSLSLNPDNWVPTLVLALLTSVLVPLAWVKDPKPVFLWLIPAWLVQAVASIHQWLAEDLPRVYGIAENINAGAAFLLLGIVVLLNGHSRARWLVLPLVAALPFSGSRWVAAVAGVVVLGLFASKVLDWRWVALGIAGCLLLVALLGWDDTLTAFNRVNTLQEHLLGSGPAVSGELPHWSYWLPVGFFDSQVHSVPVRIAQESGALAAMGWLALSLVALAARPRFDFFWWLTLTVFLLSCMYYFTWIGPLGGFWWLLIGKRLQDTTPERLTLPSWAGIGVLRGRRSRGPRPTPSATSGRALDMKPSAGRKP